MNKPEPCGATYQPKTGPYAGKILRCTKRADHVDEDPCQPHEDDRVSPTYTVTWYHEYRVKP